MRTALIAQFALLVGIWAVPAMAQDFDGSKPLLCASMDIRECDRGMACETRQAIDVNAPLFFRVNFAENRIDGRRADGTESTTAIERIENVDNKIILQGVDDGIDGVRDGLGWSLAIAMDSGRMVLTGAGDDVAFAIFGACMPD